MATKKTVFHSFSSSDEELAYLHSMSKDGWQLADVRFWTLRFVRDTDAVYRYAVNVQHELTLGEFREYRAEFEEHGWTYVTRCGDLYFFRKPYDPLLPEAAYLLKPCDRETQDDRKELISNIAYIALMLAWILYYPCVPVLLISVGLLLPGVIRFFRQMRLEEDRKPDKGSLLRRRVFLAALLLVSFLLFFAYPLIEKGTREVEHPAPAAGVQRITFSVKLPDIYGIYAETYGSEKPVVLFSITDRDGRPVTSGSLSTAESGQANRFLLPGRYTMTLDWGDTQEPEYRSRYAGVGNPAPLIPGLPWWLMIPVISLVCSTASLISQAGRQQPNRKPEFYYPY